MALIPDRQTRTALRVIRRQMGAILAIAVARAVRVGTSGGAPFADLAPTTDPHETRCRAQSGAAVLLYRTLRKALPEYAALGLTGDVIEACGVRFLEGALGLPPWDAVQAEAAAGKLAAAEWRPRDGGGSLEVRACRRVELVREAGHPELAPLFCRADARFLTAAAPHLVVQREAAIADGAAACTLVLADPGPSDAPMRE